MYGIIFIMYYAEPALSADLSPQAIIGRFWLCQVFKFIHTFLTTSFPKFYTAARHFPYDTPTTGRFILDGGSRPHTLTKVLLAEVVIHTNLDGGKDRRRLFYEK
jgi:hypothetical protein